MLKQTILLLGLIALSAAQFGFGGNSEECGTNEVFEGCGSSSCWELKCPEDALNPPSPVRPCTMDCRQGCKCADGFYRDSSGKCVSKEVCLSAEKETKEVSHNCRSRERWSPEKTEWCCKNKGLGCPVENKAAKEATHNCRSRERWSPEKTEWCCKNKGLGCPPVENKAAKEATHNCRSRERWSEEKTEWCCRVKGLGCPVENKMAKKKDCLAGDIMARHGDRLGHIGRTCTGETSYTGTQSFCNDGEIDEEPYQGTCPTGLSCCQSGPVGSYGGATCVTTCEADKVVDPLPKMCCMAMTAQCLSCTKDMTPEEFCADPTLAWEAPDCDRYQTKPKSMPKMCCMAMTAQCLSCTKDMTPEEFCADSTLAWEAPDCVDYQTKPKSMPKMCCMAMTAQCLSCTKDMTPEEFCADSTLAWEAPDCVDYQTKPTMPKMCCMAMTAQCLSCTEDMTPEEFCADPTLAWRAPDCADYKPKPTMPKMCCRAMTAECLACTKDVTVAEFCSNPEWAQTAPDCADISKVTSKMMKPDIPSGVAPSAPRYLSTRKTAKGTLVTWVQPKDNFNCDKDSYVVRYREFKKKVKAAWTEVPLQETGSPFAIIPNLTPGLTYQVQVTPVSSSGLQGKMAQKRFKLQRK